MVENIFRFVEGLEQQLDALPEIEQHAVQTILGTKAPLERVVELYEEVPTLEMTPAATDAAPSTELASVHSLEQRRQLLNEIYTEQGRAA